MTGADIISALLRAHSGVRAFVTDEGSIKEDLLPEATPAPAIVVREVSSIQKQFQSRQPTYHATDRVAVTVRARSVRQRKAMMRAVHDCCSDRTGNFGEATDASVLAAGIGPGLIGPNNTFERTEDFKVSYNHPY